MGTSDRGFSNDARREARDILSKPPFRVGKGHAPLAGALHTVGRWLDDVFGPVGRLIEKHVLGPIGHGFNGAFGGWWPYVVAALAVAGGLLLALVLVRRRSRVAQDEVRVLMRVTQEDPDALDKLALEAEVSQDHAGAVRLRFRAGLVRLEREGVIARRDILTTRQLRDEVPSKTFGRLATDLEEIVYAGQAATGATVSAAREGWPRVPVEVRASVGSGSR